jgi:hypothetical protein
MTKLQFNSKLKALNINLSKAVTRNDQSLADTAINNLVDSYVNKTNCTINAEANEIALMVAG